MYSTTINMRRLGIQKEQKVIDYLSSLGYQIIEHNFYCPYGEIDIIAKEGGYLVFIEVKFRSGTNKGYPVESISRTKRRHIANSSMFFLKQRHISFQTPCRYDIVVMLQDKIDVIQNAFTLYE